MQKNARILVALFSIFLFASVSGSYAVGKVNINTASVEQLSELPGIGGKTAERIVQKREELGKFKTIEDLKQVKGIGDKKFEKLKPHITI